MYSIKEKIFHHRQLRNAAAASADLELLKSKSTGTESLIRYENAPERNADDILYQLLDVATHEEIVVNRRKKVKNHPAEDSAKGEKEEKGKNSTRKSKAKSDAPEKKSK